MTTGYEAGFYRDIESMRIQVRDTLPDIRDALLLLALASEEKDVQVTEGELIAELREQLLGGILIRHGVRRAER